MPRLSPPALRRLRTRLAAEPDALPFAEAVATQLAHPPGAQGDPDAERAAVDRIVGFLAAAAGGGDGDDLLADPALLSAVFQNLDLLYAPGIHPPDGVALLLARLIDRAESAP